MNGSLGGVTNFELWLMKRSTSQGLRSFDESSPARREVVLCDKFNRECMLEYGGANACTPYCCSIHAARTMINDVSCCIV